MKKLQSLIREYEEEIYDALRMDLGKHPLETYASENGFVLQEIALMLRNLKKWSGRGLLALSVANLIFFVVNPQTLNAVLVVSEVRIYSTILSFITLLCNGPLGDFFILCAAPSMLKKAKT